MSPPGDDKESPIDCPRCGIPLKEETVQRLGPDVQIDVCTKCMGTWYDRGELAAVIKDRKIANALTEEPIKGIMGPMACPRCGGRMRVREEWGVEVDVCTSCKGVWLDLEETKTLEAKVAKALEDEGPQRKRELAFYRALDEVSHQ